MRDPWRLVVAVMGCELVGILSTPFTLDAIPTWYQTLLKPAISPPNWVFGPVWTLLYLLMGISFYLVWQKGVKKKGVRSAIYIFLAQLALNFYWTFLFFGFRSPLLGFIGIVALLAMIFATIIKFYPISKNAAYLLIPYFAWVCFASTLNFSILVLNM